MSHSGKDHTTSGQLGSLSNLDLRSNPNTSGRSGSNPSSDADSNKTSVLGSLAGFGTLAVVGTVGFLATRYKTAQSNEYLVRTGILINDIAIDKKAFHLPFQTLTHLSLAPKSYSFNIHSMSNEKMEFYLPAVFTVGPKDDMDHLKAYAKFLLYESDETVMNIVRGMIEGETRMLAANMSIESIFNGRAEFKEKIVHNVQEELSKLGLTIFNANIKELQDGPDSRYFKALAQKIAADAENQAKIDISEAKKKGDIGQKEREGDTRRQVMQIEAETKIFENARDREMELSKADLAQKKAEYQQKVLVAQAESELNAQKRREELQKEVELKKLERETERIRAQDLSKSRVQAEIKAVDAAGESDAMKRLADAKLYSETRNADAVLIMKTKEAEGTKAMYEAQAQGLHKVLESFQGDTRAMLNYFMIEKELYPKLAQEAANAIKGLNPKVTIWNTSNGSGNGNGSFDGIHNLAKSIPPLMKTIEEQTGISLPDWVVKKSDNYHEDFEVAKNKVQEVANDNSQEAVNDKLQEAVKNIGSNVEIPQYMVEDLKAGKISSIDVLDYIAKKVGQGNK